MLNVGESLRLRFLVNVQVNGDGRREARGGVNALGVEDNSG